MKTIHINHQELIIGYLAFVIVCYRDEISRSSRAWIAREFHQRRSPRL